MICGRGVSSSSPSLLQGEFVKSVEEEYQVVKSVRAEEYNIEKKREMPGLVLISLLPQSCGG